jgi:Uma2 family endonuclease
MAQWRCSSSFLFGKLHKVRRPSFDESDAMKKTQSPARAEPGTCVLLSDIDWRTYSRLLRVFAERRSVRLTYDRGDLEIALKRAISPPQEVPGRSVLLSDVDWPTYSKLLRIFAERPGVRLTYDRGELEIMSPLLEHDRPIWFLGSLVIALAEELGMPLTPGGAVTLRRHRRQRGLEADASFWIANAHRIAGRRRLDLRTDPPPDLAIEIDVSRSSLNRLAMYAKLGVPELWRLDGDTLTFHALGADNTYQNIPASLSFPLVTPADLSGFVLQAHQSGDLPLALRRFREWIRQRRAAEAPPRNNPPN